jgi:uncharacterized protein
VIPATARPRLPAAAGIGLRAPHHDALQAARPAVGWLEAHSENYFPQGGAQPAILERLRADYPLALHGVGLSIGSTDPLDLGHVASLQRMIARFEPALVSEHLCWGSIGGRHLNDLLPLPYSEEALRHLVPRVRELQQRLGRQVLLENVSSYLQFAGSTLAEWDFLGALVAETGCGLLLDVNNVHVSARNHGFDARDYVAALPPAAIGEIHLAGHDVTRVGSREIRIDTHAQPVCEEVWALYRFAITTLGPVPTLVEWDTDIPPLGTLVAEAARADAEARAALAVAA